MPQFFEKKLRSHFEKKFRNRLFFEQREDTANKEGVLEKKNRKKNERTALFGGGYFLSHQKGKKG